MAVQTIEIHKLPVRRRIWGKLQLENLAWDKDEIVPCERHLVLVSSGKALAQLAEVQLTELTEDLWGVGPQMKKPRQAPKHITKSTQALKSGSKEAKLLLVFQIGTESGADWAFQDIKLPLLSRLEIAVITRHYLWNGLNKERLINEGRRYMKREKAAKESVSSNFLKKCVLNIFLQEW